MWDAVLPATAFKWLEAIAGMQTSSQLESHGKVRVVVPVQNRWCGTLLAFRKILAAVKVG